MEVRQEWVPLAVGDKEDTLLGPDAFYFIVLNNELLLKNLDGVEFPTSLRLGKHDLAKVTLAKHGQEVEVVETDLLTCAWICSRREGLLCGYGDSRGRGDLLFGRSGHGLWLG